MTHYTAPGFYWMCPFVWKPGVTFMNQTSKHTCILEKYVNMFINITGPREHNNNLFMSFIYRDNFQTAQLIYKAANNQLSANFEQMHKIRDYVSTRLLN